jgi:hypothetical protein
MSPSCGYYTCPNLNWGTTHGIYILYDGLFPVYVGKADQGSIRGRIRDHNKSKRMKNYWDNFSWYLLKDRKNIHEIETLLLRILPYFSRILTGMGGKLRAEKVAPATDEVFRRKIPKYPPKKIKSK